MFRLARNTLLLFVFCLIINIGLSSAFLGETSLDLYSDIDEGLFDLEEKETIFELNGGEDSSSSEKINDVLLAKGYSPCIAESISSADISNISKNGDVELLAKHISDDCKKDGKISVGDMGLMISEINGIYTNAQEVAERKTKGVNDVAKIGIYSDGLDENSSFDLLSDLFDIDSIIFTEEVKYEGEEYENVSDYINDNLGLSNINLLDSQILDLNLNEDDGGSSSYNGTLSNSVSYTINNSELNYVCSDDVNNGSGLDQDTIDDLFGNSSNGLGGGFNNDEDLSSLLGELIDNQAPPYTPVNDNPYWDCDDSFYCIKIEFEMYDHKLLGGGDSFSIEYVINKSNEHLSKFAGTFLGQSKMTKNIFELNLRDISLPDMFHAGIYVFAQAPPILNLEKAKEANKENEENEDEENTDRFSVENLLREYYRDLGLEYDRRNSIVQFKAKEEELKSLIDASELQTSMGGEKFSEYVKALEDISIRADLTNRAVEQKVLTDEGSDFEAQFTGLEDFSTQLRDYAEKTYAITKLMAKIKIHK